MLIVEKKLKIKDLKEIAQNFFGDMVKGVVDIEKNILVIDAELHSDLESYLLQNGSKQTDLWGINLYPELSEEDFIEFDSLINIRPTQNNRSRGVEDENIRKKITALVQQRIDINAA